MLQSAVQCYAERSHVHNVCIFQRQDVMIQKEGIPVRPSILHCDLEKKINYIKFKNVYVAQYSALSN